MHEAPSYYAHRITMVVEGSSEPQRYRDQMKFLMPRVAKCLEWGIPGTFPLRALRDIALMGAKGVDTRVCVCNMCAVAEPEPEPEPEPVPEEEAGEEEVEEWDE